MPKLKLKNVSAVKIGGKLPGQSFSVEADGDGNPVDAFWRQRLDEEAKFNVGAIVKVVASAPDAPVPSPSPASVASPDTSTPAAPAAPAKKGK